MQECTLLRMSQSFFKKGITTIFFFSLCLFVSARPFSVTISSLTCEYRHNPLGIESSSPAFTWILKSNERNIAQSAYEIIVGDDLDQVSTGKGNMWAPGKISSSESTLIV